MIITVKHKFLYIFLPAIVREFAFRAPQKSKPKKTNLI
ncbi:hypothetical protein BSPLISOX_1172 [uncultured Gammaproteobacteria bacterium]|nr:hypothetical protein BSPLISOX_1172 [uncultured Gammaproteobacteria bacterium]